MRNKLFLERTELLIETSEKSLNFIFPKDYKITDPKIINGVEIKWDYKSVNEEPNEFNIEIQGLAVTTIAKIQLKDKVKLTAGYGTDIGEIAAGIISRKEVDKGVLKIKCREVPADFKKLVSAGYAPGTTASFIIKDLAGKIGFTVKQCDLKTDKVYSIGESILGSGLYEIGQIVKDCDSKMTTKNDFIYIYNNEPQDKGKIKLSYESGLLEEPKPQNIEEISYKVEKTKQATGKSTSNKKKDDKKSKKKSTKTSSKAKAKKKEELKYDYEIKCLLIYLLKKGDLIELISNDISSVCQIVEISDISDFIMTLKVRVVNNQSDVKNNKNELEKRDKAVNRKGKTQKTKRKGKK